MQKFPGLYTGFLRTAIAAVAGSLLFTLTLTGQTNAFFTSGTKFTIPYANTITTTDTAVANQDSVRTRLLITGAQQTCGVVSIPAHPFYRSFQLETDSFVIIDIPEIRRGWLEVPREDSSLRAASIHIESRHPVQAVLANDVGRTDSLNGSGLHTALANKFFCDASSLAPDYRAGRNYLLHIPNHNITGWENGGGHQLWANPVDDSTALTLNLNGRTLYKLYPLMQDTTIVLQADEFLIARLAILNGVPPPLDPNIGFSGSSFHSPKAFHLFAGKYYPIHGYCVPLDHSPFWRDEHAFHEVKPAPYTDTLHLAAPLQDHYPNLYSILAWEDSTVVRVNGQVLDTVNRSEQVDTCWDGPAVISASRPVTVLLSRNSTDPNAISNQLNSSVTSGFTLPLPGESELIRRSIVKPFSEDYDNTYVLALFTPARDTARLSLNGQSLPPGSWQSFAHAPQWAWAQIETDDHIQIVESTGKGFFGYHYSYMKLTPNFYHMPSYGYCLTESQKVEPDSMSFYLKGADSDKVRFAELNRSFCTGDTLYFYPGQARHITWKWDFGDGKDSLQVVGEKTPGPVMHQYDQPGQYLVHVSDSEGCTPGDSLWIEISEGPQPDFSGQVIHTCRGPEIQLNNHSTGVSQWQWQLPDGTSSMEKAPRLPYPDYPNALSVRLTVSDGQCETSITRKIEPDKTDVFDPDHIPNVFTPNGDGINDCFAIKGISGFEDCTRLSIFNRLGTEVYTTTDPKTCWEGGELPGGVYFYLLQIGEQSYHGSVHLVR